MSIQTLDIGATPCEEACAQVGRKDYPERSRRECLVFQHMLERLYPAPNDRAWLKVKSFPHDFGSYRAVCVCYADDDEAACDYAFMLERETPCQWDAIAHYELLWRERKTRLVEAAARGEIVQDDIPAQYLAGDFPVLPEDKSLSELFAAFPL